MTYVETDDLVQELRRALLEIEWTSRRSTTKATLARINNIARAALVAQTAARHEAENDLELLEVA